MEIFQIATIFTTFIAKIKEYWQKNKHTYIYIYNCFSGAKGIKYYLIASGIAVSIYIATCILLEFMNAIASCLITVGIIFLLIHIDVVVKSDKFPWRNKLEDRKYTHIKKGLLEPLKNIRDIIYNKVGISTDTQPKLKGFVMLVVIGVAIIVLLAIIPIKVLMRILLVILCIGAPIFNWRSKKEIEKHEMVKELYEDELKKQNLYLSKQEVYDLKTSKKQDPETLEKYSQAKVFKNQFKKEIQTSNIDVETFMKSRVENMDTTENQTLTEEQKMVQEKMKNIIGIKERTCIKRL